MSKLTPTELARLADLYDDGLYLEDESACDEITELETRLSGENNGSVGWSDLVRLLADAERQNAALKAERELVPIEAIKKVIDLQPKELYYASDTKALNEVRSWLAAARGEGGEG